MKIVYYLHIPNMGMILTVICPQIDEEIIKHGHEVYIWLYVGVRPNNLEGVNVDRFNYFYPKISETRWQGRND